MPDKITSLRIKQQDGTYSDQILIGAIAENVVYNNEYNVKQVLGNVNMNKGSLQQQIDNKADIQMIGTPFVAATVSAMTDHDKIYVYTGSQSGMINGNWYYWNGAAWTSGGVYNSVAVQTDPSLTIANQAADAQATGKVKNTVGLMDILKGAEWEVGSINASGVPTESTSRIRMVNSVPMTARKIAYTVDTGYRIAVLFYSYSAADEVLLDAYWLTESGVYQAPSGAVRIKVVIEAVPSGTASLDYADHVHLYIANSDENNGFEARGLASGGDANDCAESGWYRLASNSTYLNLPDTASGQRLLLVFGVYGSTNGLRFQIYFNMTTGTSYMRMRTGGASGTYTSWTPLADLSAVETGLASLQTRTLLQSLASGSNLNDVKAPGVYRLGTNDAYTNSPVGTNRRRLLFVDAQTESGTTPHQMMVAYDTGEVWTRCYHDSAWDAWINNNNELLKYILTQSLDSGTDLNNVKVPGIYRLSTSGTYPNTPIGTYKRRILFVDAQTESGTSPYQIMVGYDTGEIWTRCYHDSAWDEWKCAYDVMARKMMLGANPYRKALDHGGFFYNTRYGSKQIYQNSPESFITSTKEGIMFHNVDIVFSSDGVPFAAHDIEVPLASGGTINLNNLTAEQIKTYSVGDSDYSWTLQTLAECNAFIKSIGGTIDMVDITSQNNDTQKAFTAALPAYYRANVIRPCWTNTDYSTHRDAFMTNGPEFGVYFVCNSAASIQTALSYIQNYPDKHFCLNIYYSDSTARTAMEPYMADVLSSGATIYVYIYSSANADNVPGFAEGVLSNIANINFLQWQKTIK